MPPKKSNLNNARSKGARRKRADRAHESTEQSAERIAAQRIRTAEIRAQESREQHDKKIITTNTASRDEAQELREPTLGPTWYNIYDSHLHITEETVKVEHIDEGSNEDISKSDDNTFVENIKEITYEPKAKVKFEFDDDEQLTCNTEVDVCHGKHITKSELVEINGEQEVIGNSFFKTFDNKNEIKSESSGPLGYEENQIDESNEVCEVMNQRWKRRINNPILLRNLRSDTLPRHKELGVLPEDIMLSKCNTQDFCKQITTTASLIKDNGNGNCSSIKGGIPFEEDDVLETLTISTDTNKALKYENTTIDNSYVSDPCNISQTISTRTSNVNSNNLIPNNSVFNCTYCSYKTYQKGQLNQHINSKHTKNIVYDCSYCGYKSNQKSNLNRHINSRHIKSTVFNCPYCSHKTYAKSRLDKHINSQHTKSTVFHCSHCSYKSYAKSNLDQHMNSQHTKNTVFNCPYCSHKAYLRSNLDRHINSQHTKSTVFNCSHCSYKAYCKSHLDQHINSMHTKSTVFNCLHCSYKAYAKSNLDQHINYKHTKSTVFNCPDCSYQAYAKSNLAQHINSKHTKSNVFNCPHCSYKAYARSNLYQHINSKHTSSMFNCSDCDFKTFYNQVLSKHVKAKHS